MSTGDQPTEEELRAAYEAEIKKIRVEQILLDQVVSLVNLGMRRTGLSPGTEDERDLGQVRLSIEAVRALLPVIEQAAPPQAAPIRDALSQLQMAFVRLGGSVGGLESEQATGSGSGSGSGETPGGGGGQSPPSGGAGEPGAGGSGSGPGGSGSQAPPGPPDSETPKPGEPGPAQRSGRLWVPGQ
jgi:hypothetical protein